MSGIVRGWKEIFAAGVHKILGAERGGPGGLVLTLLGLDILIFQIPNFHNLEICKFGN